MAKYLWVGFGGTATGTNIVDQYCFNKPGNWRLEIISNGVPTWTPTSLTPGNGDRVYFGKQGAVAGWTAAKSPCLFGGFSGGVGAGTWSNTGATLTQGFTFNAFLASITMLEQKQGYPFPYLGGGITGEIAEWCAARDGVTVGYYNTSNSTGFRDPTQNLRLKWSETAFLWAPDVIPASVAAGVTNPANYTIQSKFVVDFDAVKATVFASGGSGGTAPNANNPVVSTNLYFNSGGGGLRVRGGSFKDVYLNQNPGQQTAAATEGSYSNIADYGIEVYNAFIDELTLWKSQATYISGCTAALIDIYHFPWARNVSNNTYAEQVDAEIASDVSALSAFTDLYGVTQASELPSYTNQLSLKYNPAYIGSGYETVPSPSLRSNTKNVVIIGDRFGSKIIRIPTINIDAGSDGGGASAASGYLYMPWALEFAGTVVNNITNNNAGFVYSNEDIDQSSSVNITELRMRNQGVLDFSERNQSFDNWKFGGFTASGTQIYGGIIFQDETGKVYGSEGVRLWNTQTKAGGVINARITDVKASLPPTSLA